MAKGKKYYVVWVGNKPGVYDNWDACLAQTKSYGAAKYKSFPTRDAAHTAFLDGFAKHIGNGNSSKSGSKTSALSRSHIIADSMSVDAACSGNPGLMEYQGVHTTTKEEIFRQGPFPEGTNNVGEFLALVHALALLKRQNREHTVIYTDSLTAMAWVRNKKIKTTLGKTSKNAILFDMMDRALKWLHDNSFKNPIIKWETKSWGEIPADFGRK